MRVLAYPHVHLPVKQTLEKLESTDVLSDTRVRLPTHTDPSLLGWLANTSVFNWTTSNLMAKDCDVDSLVWIWDY